MLHSRGIKKIYNPFGFGKKTVNRIKVIDKLGIRETGKNEIIYQIEKYIKP